MIRYRQPLKDDRAICNLVIKELLPRSYKVREFQHLDYRLIRKDVKERLYKGTTFVAAGRHEPLHAFIHLIPRNDTLYIDMLAVNSSKQNKGWGARLLQLAERHGRSKGLASASLYVDMLNDKAQRFYARHGYRLHSFHQNIQCYLLTKPL
ncbi:GNAT family N-acetyltransferase [Paenibacillus gansuensis]|uniref:GNAT family N-acetyltransferase n=1 Tax=Paenibacillus gansuensis TaxID=306542 RepID=A0ABW5P742_9BACL